MRTVSPRVMAEWLLHAVATAVIAVLLWRSLQPATTSASVSAATVDLAASLPRWTRDGAPDSLSLRLERVPDVVTRDWLVALRRAGTVMTWSAERLTPGAITAERVPDPQGGVLVRVGAPAGAPISLADDGGVVDSSLARRGVAAFRLAALAGPPRAMVLGQEMSARAADSLTLRRILVLGRVGWESKFTIVALEERGWLVDARLALAPGQAVTQGNPARVDTSRYSAVIVLDTAGVVNAPAIARYVNDGGGLIVGGAGAMTTRLAPLLPGRSRRRVVPRQRLTDTLDLVGAHYPITALRRDALVLERADTVVTIAARRAGAGRVVQLADEETWRRRMRRVEGSVDEHRAWWARLVASVAYVPRVTTTIPSEEAAPVASLIAALGTPAQAQAASSPARNTHPNRWMFTILALALVGEWASRRWRGAA